MPDWIRHPATARLRRERALSRSRTWSHCPPDQVRVTAYEGYAAPGEARPSFAVRN